MLRIVQYPSPVLARVAEPCMVGDPTLVRLANDMANIMYKSDGVGLAAPQVGISKRLIVVDCDVSEDATRNPIALVNPEIIETSGKEVASLEGCLSCPGVSISVTRKPQVKVRYYDLDGVQKIITGKGLLARCLQHEIDHLNGITLFESCDPADLPEALEHYEEAKKRHARPGDVG